MSRQAIELSYAVRFRVLGKYYGQLCIVLAVLTLAPLGVALGSGEMTIVLRYLVLVAVLLGIGSILGSLRSPRQIQTNEAMILAALTFLATPLLMTYPMMGAGLGFVDALFEAISATTTTGLSTLTSVESKPLPFLFARAWMQWYGGLGIVVLSLALVIRPGMTLKCLAVTEEIGDDLVGGARAHARRVVIVYAALTALSIAALLLAGSGLFNAVVYTFSAVSTGGFSPHDTSLGHFSGWAIPWLTTLACLAGSLPLSLYHQSWLRGWKNLLIDPQFQALLAFVLAVSAALALCLRFVRQLPWEQTLFHAPLLALSAQTTAGFATLGMDSLDASSKLIMILAMAAGGGLGSTAGGIKLIRLIIILRLLQLTLVRTCLPPHAVLATRLGGRDLHDEEINQALLFSLLFLAVVIFSWLPFLALGYDPLNSLFEVVSATGTVGLSAGVTGPNLPSLLKGVLCADMLMGRLEILAWLVMLFPRTWIGKRVEEL